MLPFEIIHGFRSLQNVTYRIIVVVYQYIYVTFPDMQSLFSTLIPHINLFNIAQGVARYNHPQIFYLRKAYEYSHLYL